MTTDPTALAREVLAIDTSAIGGNIIVDGVDVLETVRAAQKAARAVLDLTDTVKRVEALADDMDHDAGLLDQTDDLRLHLIAATHREDATRLRTALNGDPA